jgi:hypothetical protein
VGSDGIFTLFEKGMKDNELEQRLEAQDQQSCTERRRRCHADDGLKFVHVEMSRLILLRVVGRAG